VRLLFIRLFLFLAILGVNPVLPEVWAGTKLVQSWAAPGIGNYSFKHILTICIAKDPGNRQMVENYMAFEIKKGNPFQAYNVLNESDFLNKDQAKQKIQQLGFDGAVVMRLLRAQDKVTYVPGAYPPYYGSFWGYYGWAWSSIYDPGYVYTDKIYQVETTIYSIKDDKLLWDSVTQTTNPKSIEDAVAGIAKAIYKEMGKRGLVK
jgi:hypothetical protein